MYIYGTSLPDKKYYDAYPVNSNGNRADRILGNATGEMGPFSGNTSSWYGDCAWFVSSSNSWFQRGGYWGQVSSTGVFYFSVGTGLIHGIKSFCVVLAF